MLTKENRLIIKIGAWKFRRQKVITLLKILNSLKNHNQKIIIRSICLSTKRNLSGKVDQRETNMKNLLRAFLRIMITRKNKENYSRKYANLTICLFNLTLYSIYITFMAVIKAL